MQSSATAGDAERATPAADRLDQHRGLRELWQLKQLVGGLSLEKKLLLDRLTAVERG